MPLRDATLEDLTIGDAAVFEKIALYRGLKRHLKDVSYRFRVGDRADPLSWDRALFLNLTFWSPREGADVLCDDHIAADVVAHVAWHHVVAARVASGNVDEPPTAAALFFGESIASAFDLYLVGRLVQIAPDSDFITSQVPIMTEAAQQAGLSDDPIEALFRDIHDDPERAFEDMRALLFDVSVALHACHGVDDALEVLTRFAHHRFAALLHHYQLSNWILYAHAHARANADQDARVAAFDKTLRSQQSSLDWLAAHWVSDDE